MFYKPKISQQSNISILESTNLYDGINYQVIRTPKYIIKQYQSESTEQINELLKRIEFEFIIAQRNKNLIIQAISYQIQNRDVIYLNLIIEDAGINIQQLIELKYNKYKEQYDKEYKNKNKQIQEQQILDDQLFKELVDDEEQIGTKQKLSGYDEQFLAESVKKQIYFPSEKLDLILKNSLMDIQHLENQGIRFTQMKLSNIFLNESSMRYTDLINHSSLFEETLQQYLRIEEDEIEPPHDQSHLSHLFQLGLVILQITLLKDFKIDYQLNLHQQGINQTKLSGYVKSIKSSQSNFLVTMLELMLNLKGNSMTYITDILQSKIYKQLTYVEDKQQKQQQLQIMEKKQIVQDRLAKYNISSIHDFWDQQNPQHQILSTKKVQKESLVRKGIYIIKPLNAKKILKTTNIILTIQVINLDHNKINNVKFIIFSTQNGSIHLIDYQKFDDIADYQCSLQSLNNSIIIHRQNNINYITGGSDKKIYVFAKIDIQQWLNDGFIQPKLVLQGHNSHITTLDSLKNGKILASGDREGYILLWDMIKFDQIIGIKIHDGALNQILQITLLRLASCSSDTVIKIWELEEIIKPDGNPAEVQILEGHRSEILRMVISIERLISFEKDGKVRIWLWRKEKELFQFLYFLQVQNNIRSIACVKESIFVVGDVSGWINIVNFDERLVVNKLKLHSNSVICMINILNGGQLILSSGQDGLIKKFFIKNE